VVPSSTDETSHGLLTLAIAADVLDIGVSGLAIESDTRLAPASDLLLTIGDRASAVSFEGRVVWCFFHGTRPGSGGEPLPVYRAGIEFSDVLTPRAERLVELLEGLAAASGETRLFGRFRLSSSEPVRVQLPGPFRCLEVSPQAVTVEARLPLEPPIGCVVDLRLNGIDDSIVAHVTDARREPRSEHWRLTLAVETASNAALTRLRELGGR